MFLLFLSALAIGTLPASLLASRLSLPPEVRAVHGHALHGQLLLKGGAVAEWRLAPRHLLRGELVAKISLVGSETRITGALVATPRSVALRDFRGVLGPDLLSLATQEITCTGGLRVTVDVATFQGSSAAADGSFALGETLCQRPNRPDIPLPALEGLLSAEGDSIVLRIQTEAAEPLAYLALDGKMRLVLRIEPRGAALIPGLPAGPIEVETHL